MLKPNHNYPFSPHDMTTISQNNYPSTHLLHRKPAACCSLCDTPLHLPWIHCLHCLQLILSEPMPFLQNPLSLFPKHASHFITFVFPKFTLNPLSSLVFLYFWIFSTSSSSVSAIKTKSSAFSSSRPSLNSLDETSSTMTESISSELPSLNSLYIAEVTNIADSIAPSRTATRRVRRSDPWFEKSVVQQNENVDNWSIFSWWRH